MPHRFMGLSVEYDLLFRWFVGLGIEDPVWDATTFTKKRDRLLAGDVAQHFLAALLAQKQVKRMLSSEHFSVDGTLLEAWASVKSFRPKDASDHPPGSGRNGERRRNDTHASEPHAERPRPVTLGADKGYESTDFVMELREQAVTPHLAQNQSGRRSAIDGRTTRHPGYAGLAARPQAHRRGLRPGQHAGRAAQAAAPRTAQGRLAIHPDDGRPRSRPIAEIAGRGRTMTVRLGPLAAPPEFLRRIARDRRPRPRRCHSRQPLMAPRRPISPKFDRFSTAC